MKDKLVKHHRQVSYFRMKRFLIILTIAVAVISLVAIPLGISIAQLRV